MLNTPETFRVVTTESGFQPYSTVKRLTRNQGLQTFSEKLSGLLMLAFNNVTSECDRYPLFVCSRSHVENLGSITYLQSLLRIVASICT